jgi:hypothetical protein
MTDGSTRTAMASGAITIEAEDPMRWGGAAHVEPNRRLRPNTPSPQRAQQLYGRGELDGRGRK